MDEVGNWPYGRKSPTALFTSGLACHEQSIPLPTSNKGFGEWSGLLDESMIAMAALDRLPRHSRTLSMGGERHRLREKRRGGTIPDTVYMKTLYRIAGQDYCRHHIIKAAVAAGLIIDRAHGRLCGGHELGSVPHGALPALPGMSLTSRQPQVSPISLEVKTVEEPLLARAKTVARRGHRNPRGRRNDRQPGHRIDRGLCVRLGKAMCRQD